MADQVDVQDIAVPQSDPVMASVAISAYRLPLILGRVGHAYRWYFCCWLEPEHDNSGELRNFNASHSICLLRLP